MVQSDDHRVRAHPGPSGQISGGGRGVARIEGVISADVVTGPYDVIAMAESASIDDLGKLVVARIQAVDGVTRTLTCPVIRS